MCSRYITNLTPERSSLQGHQIEEEVSKVLKDVQRYNRLFVGGISGLLQKIYELPLLMKRAFRQMMDPDTPESYLSEVRLFAMTLSILYASTSFDFIPTGGLGIVRLFDYAAFAMVISLRLVGVYLRWRLNRRMRRLAAAPQLLEE
jgi:RING finger protein 170